MAIGGNSSIDNPKPSRPIKAGRKKISFNISSIENNQLATELNSKVNFALEVLKFMPKWELQKYEGEINKQNISLAMTQYAPTTNDGEGNNLVSFGNVVRSMSGTTIAGTNMGKYLSGVEFYDEASDFDHLQDQINNEPETPVTANISSELWQKTKEAMLNKEGNYYDIMMEGIDSYTPEEAFYLMTSLLESRERATSFYQDVFGEFGATNQAVRSAVENWLSKYEDNVDNKKLSIVNFFLNVRQSFFSRIFPMFGATNEFYESDLDKSKAQSFFNQLSEKVGRYIGVSDLTKLEELDITSLTAEQEDALLLWNQWVNPEKMLDPEDNVNPQDTEWGEEAYGSFDKFFDLIVHDNLFNRIVYRTQFLDYKESYEKYEEKEEENRIEEVKQEQRTAKRKSEVKATENKSSQKSAALKAGGAGKKNKNSGVKNKAGSFASTLKRIAGRVSQAQGKSASAVVSKVTPAKTAKFSGTTKNKQSNNSANNIAPTGAVKRNSGAASRLIAASNKRVTAAIKKTASKKPSPKNPSKQALTGTSSSRRVALSRQLTQRNIQSQAPKQKKQA